MHAMSGRVVRLDRQERPGTDVKRHTMERDAISGQRFNEAFGEVQSGSWRSDRSLVVRKHGLIIGTIARVGGAAARDIGRQWHVAALGERLIERGTVKCEGKSHLTTLAFGLNGSVELVEETNAAFAAETHHIAEPETLRR